MTRAKRKKSASKEKLAVRSKHAPFLRERALSFSFAEAIQGARARLDDLLPPRLSVKDQAFFAKRLSFLIKAGIPILESLAMLREQSGSKRSARVFSVVADDIANGQYLSNSLEKFPEVFSSFAVNIVRVGEQSGVLSENLNYLAEELKKKRVLKRKIIGALIYPAVVTLASLGITGVLTVYIFPKIIPIFTSLNMQLPLSTRIVMAVSSFLRGWGIEFLAFLVIAVFAGLWLVRRFGTIHDYFDRGMLSFPVLGSMVRDYNLSNAMRTLGLLLRSGIALREALPITARTTANRVYQGEFLELGEVVNRGGKIAGSLGAKPRLFPPVLCQMIAVGERSGNLSDTLIYLSEFYENEVDELTKNLSSMVEPVLMVCMGLIVGFVAVSVITPIYGITQHLQPK